ncbi:MAG TPA: MBL fold metallo-hydrolase [Sporichthyaceae bacterium]|nr:MBL fold metallo-hydrolase [Sporichthyaceae bacterium]
MRLTVVGCSGSFPGPTSPASCYLVEADGFRVLLDLGAGALGALATHVDVGSIDAVVLSHLHPDHCIDMCGYYVARKYRPDGALPRIPVHGPADTPSRMAAAYGLPEDPGMTEQFDFRKLTAGEPFEIGPFRFHTDRTVHPIEAYAIRVEHGGKALVYSGDSGVCDELVRLATGADLFLCEASFHDGRDVAPDVHLTGSQAAEHATRAGVPRLLLTHIPPWNDPARTLSEAADFEGRVDLACPGATYEI